VSAAKPSYEPVAYACASTVDRSPDELARNRPAETKLMPGISE
jgi:hypothetical protein